MLCTHLWSSQVFLLIIVLVWHFLPRSSPSFILLKVNLFGTESSQISVTPSFPQTLNVMVCTTWCVWPLIFAWENPHPLSWACLLFNQEINLTYSRTAPCVTPSLGTGANGLSLKWFYSDTYIPFIHILDSKCHSYAEQRRSENQKTGCRPV
jgi:hypothetical protein